MRRLARVGSAQPASSKRLRCFTSTKASRLPFSATRAIFTHGGRVSPGEDAVTFEAQQQRGDRFREHPIAIGPDAFFPHPASGSSRSASPSS